MAKVLNHMEFIREWAKKSGLSERSMKKAYEQLENIIKEEVRVHGEFRLKNIGLIYVKSVGGYDMIKPNPLGGKAEKCFVEERNVPKMKFSSNLRDWVAGRGVSHEYKKRQRKGVLNKHDKDLEKIIQKEAQSTVQAIIKEKAQTGKHLNSIISDKKKK